MHSILVLLLVGEKWMNPQSLKHQAESQHIHLEILLIVNSKETLTCCLRPELRMM